MDEFFRVWCRELKEGYALVRVGFDAFLSQVEIEELAYPYARSTLLWIEPHPAFPHLVEDLLKMGSVVDLFFGLHNHVVHVDLKHIFDLSWKDFVHHSLIGSINVLQTEGHYVVVIVARLGYKSGALFVAPLHGDMIVT